MPILQCAREVKSIRDRAALKKDVEKNPETPHVGNADPHATGALIGILLDPDKILDLATQRRFRLLGGGVPKHYQFKRLLTKVTLTVEYRLEFCRAIPMEPDVW